MMGALEVGFKFSESLVLVGVVIGLLRPATIRRRCDSDSPEMRRSKYFDLLSWWKGNSVKYPILSNMSRDILSIPMSTVASESTFSAGGRGIEPHRSYLKPKTVEMLLCGADWARELYGLKKINQPNQDAVKDVEIDLYPSSVTS